MVQPSPDGLAQAFILVEKFIGEDACSLILGDNIFIGSGLKNHLTNSIKRAENGEATLFGYYVNDPSRFGVVELDENGKALSIEEKPTNPKSNYCVTGLYFYPKGVSKLAKKVKPSARGELEITTLNNMYIELNKVHVSLLGRGYSWLDVGTHASLLDASEYVKILEERQGIQVCCPEEIAFNNGWISKEELIEIAQKMSNNQYGKHLLNVAEGKIKY